MKKYVEHLNVSMTNLEALLAMVQQQLQPYKKFTCRKATYLS